MSTYTITGFNDDGKFKIVDNILYLIDNSKTYKGRLMNNTPFDDLLQQEYMYEYEYEYEKYMYEYSNTFNEKKNNIKQVNIAYKTLDIIEPIKGCLKNKKNIKEHNWKKYFKQIKKKKKDKLKSKMIKKEQMYKNDLKYNYGNYDISWYHIYKDNINSNFEHCSIGPFDCNYYDDYYDYHSNDPDWDWEYQGEWGSW